MKPPAIKLYPILTSIGLIFLTCLSSLTLFKVYQVFSFQYQFSTQPCFLLTRTLHMLIVTPVSFTRWSSSTFLTSESGYSCKTPVLFQRTVIQCQVSRRLPDEMSYCPQIHIGIQNLPKVRSYSVNITNIRIFILNRLYPTHLFEKTTCTNASLIYRGSSTN